MVLRVGMEELSTSTAAGCKCGGPGKIAHFGLKTLAGDSGEQMIDRICFAL